MAAPHVGQLALQGGDHLVDVVEGHEAGRGVVEVEAVGNVGDERLELPQHEAVHRVGLGPQQLQDAAGGQSAAGGRRRGRAVVVLVDEVGDAAQGLDVALGEAHRVGVDVGEAHGLPEALRQVQAGARAPGEPAQVERGFAAEEQPLVGGQGRPGIGPPGHRII